MPESSATVDAGALARQCADAMYARDRASIEVVALPST